MRSSWWRVTQPAKASTRKCRAWGMAGGYMAQTRPSPTLSRGFTRPGRFLAPYGLTPAAEISAHDKALDSITRTAAPTLREAFGIGPDASAEMMIVAGDNPSRIRSDAAFAKLCGACPIPASSGVTNRHRLFCGGHRQANATLYRIVIVRMRWHQPTIDYVARRTAQGRSKKDIVRCLKRFVAREIYNALIDDHRLRAAHLDAS